MNKERATIAIFVVIIIALALFSGFEYVQTGNLNSQLSQALRSYSELQKSLSTTTITQDTTVVVTSSLSVLYINASSVTFQVACCPILPEAFYLGDGYYFVDSIYAPPPGTMVNGTVRTQSAGVLLVFAVTHMSSTQSLNFSWSGTFAEVVPYPSNATGLDGSVVMSWFTNSTSTQPYAMQTLYLRIDTS